MNLFKSLLKTLLFFILIVVVIVALAIVSAIRNPIGSHNNFSCILYIFKYKNKICELVLL